jgi:diaphanous 1
VEVHDAEQRRQLRTPKSVVLPPEEDEARKEQVRTELVICLSQPNALPLQTLKANQEMPSLQSLMPPPSSQGYAAGKRSFGRGDLDQAIRSMRDGKRRPRPRPLSKIFLDGGRQ